MHRRSMIAVLLVTAMLFSALSCTFTAAAEDTVCTVYVSIVGNGTVTDGTHGSSNGALWIEPQIGQTITLTATPASGYEVVYWRNTETNRLVSFSPTYTFTAGSELYLELVIDTAQSVLSSLPTGGEHRVIYLTEGDNLLYSGTVKIGSTDFISRIPAVFLYSGGRTWDGWDIEAEDVAANPGTVVVHPKYKDDASYIVTTIVGNEVNSQEYAYETEITMTAPATLNGKNFSCWIVPADEEKLNSKDEISSVLREYKLKVIMNITLKAVYGAGNVPPYITRVMGDVPDFENDTVAIHTERSVSSAYTVVESGMLFSRVPIGSEEDFVLNSGDPDIHVGKSKYTTRTGTYSVVIDRWYTQDPMTGGYYYPLLYVRSFLIVRPASGGASTTIYSDIYCVDYINKNYIGPDWDNFDDPWG